MDEAPGVAPTPLLELGTPFGPATVTFLIRSAAVRSPDLSMYSRVSTKTGFGPTSSAVGMLEPVTMTSSIVTLDRSGDGVGGASWPNVMGAQSRKAAAIQIPSRLSNTRSIPVP